MCVLLLILDAISSAPGISGLTGRAAKSMQMNTLSAAGRSLLAGSLLEEEVSQEELLVRNSVQEWKKTGVCVWEGRGGGQ
jgi:hypothetical protein